MFISFGLKFIFLFLLIFFIYNFFVFYLFYFYFFILDLNPFFKNFFIFFYFYFYLNLFKFIFLFLQQTGELETKDGITVGVVLEMDRLIITTLEPPKSYIKIPISEMQDVRKSGLNKRSFRVTSTQTSKVLCCSSKQELDLWIKVINYAIKKQFR